MKLQESVVPVMNKECAEGKIPLISISIPVLNEADNIDRLYDRLTALADRMQEKCNLEFVFSDNHSSDETWNKLTFLAARDERVRAVRFARNVGFQRSILANFMHTRGDAVMQIDADLQDPPELLEKFFELWNAGYQVVYGVRRKRKEGYLINAFRKVGYWLIDKVSEHAIPRDAGDCRLVDRRVIVALCGMRSSHPYLRGMIAGLGFNQTGVEYERDARIAGESKFGVRRLIGLGLTAVFNHSVVPLRLATFVGVITLAMSVIGALYYIILRFTYPTLPVGMASIHILVLFGVGLNSLLLGIIGEYILRIYILMRSEPVAIIESSLNMLENELKL